MGNIIIIIVAVFVYGFGFGFVAQNFLSNAQLLPQEEVVTLQTISDKLNMSSFWSKISQNSCQRQQQDFSNSLDGQSLVFRKLNFINGTGDVCHVHTIYIKGHNLSGAIPEEFGNLPNLTELDLTRNCFHGSIPRILARLPLRVLSLFGNQLNGSIPPEIGNIATLTELVLEQNQLEGPLPETLGELRNLNRLVLSSNNFNETIPNTFGNLKNLTEFKIDGSRISGSIPSFIGSWTKLERLSMLGTSMEGPIPPAIFGLTSLTELRVSDLGGSNTSFPAQMNPSSFEILILRNCSLSGQIPRFFGNSMRTLDLSFNKLTGKIPWETGDYLNRINFLFLTNNSLTGEVPTWMLRAKNKYFDLSYNNFSGMLTDVSCESMENVNLVSGYSSSNKSLPWCVRKDLPCSTEPQSRSLFINCGGPDLGEYVGNLNVRGPSIFSHSSEVWAYSSTGVYMDTGVDTDLNIEDYTVKNAFPSNESNPGIFQTARIAPLSLKYYGLCLRRGSYKVTLHFAEIMFSDDENFSSLGKRIFHVFVQGKLVLTDFNIAERAGGVNIGHNVTFDDIFVDGSTLEIHLYWAGKGTTTIPQKSVYGPLISAISVTSSNFNSNL